MHTRTTISPNASPYRPGSDRPGPVSRGRGRLRAAVDQLAPETIEAIAQRVAELLREPHATPAAPQLVNAEQLAHQLGLTRAWVYQHADDLGAIRLGHGPKARLRFNPTAAAQALADHAVPPSASLASRSKQPRGRPRRKSIPTDDLLPIRARAMLGRICPGAASPSE